MNQIKKFAAFTIALLSFIGAFRWSEYSDKQNFPLLSYFNISNLLTYTIDIVHSLLYFVALIIIYLISTPESSNDYWHRRTPTNSSSRCKFVNLLLALLLSIACYIFYSCFAEQLNLLYNMILKIVAGAIIVYIVIIMRSYWRVDTPLLVYVAIVSFLVCYMKINGKYETYASNLNKNKSGTIVIFKDDSARKTEIDTFDLIGSTTDFLLLKPKNSHPKQNIANGNHLDTNSETSIVVPMSEVKMVKYYGPKAQPSDKSLLLLFTSIGFAIFGICGYVNTDRRKKASQTP